MNALVRSLLMLAAIVTLLASCRKDGFTDSPDALLSPQIDTLHFDTVFTTTGSFTQAFKIFNDNNKGIHVSSVRLAGGDASPFKINVDGVAGPHVTGLDIAGGDSAYVFVTVHINPNADNLPFVVRDSIEIAYNGNTELIQLDAYGQNAHFLRNQEITGSETWEAGLPYVILGGLTVDTTATLTINKGCRIYLHADAPLLVNGTLKVLGEHYDSTRVVFSGDRLDAPYRDFPASFPGLIFTDVSRNNELTYAVIKNAYQALVAEGPSPTAAPKLTLHQVIIDNAYDIGLLGLNSSITAQNLLVSNCGKNIILAGGGNYHFTHCTAASYSNSYLQHKDPVLTITNFINQTIPPRSLTATFTNCIFWAEGGLVDDEVVLAKEGSTTFDVAFNGVLWKVKTPPALATTTGTVLTDAPGFEEIDVPNRIFNFRLQEGSPARNAGTATALTLDLDGAPRPAGAPDLGAYERQ